MQGIICYITGLVGQFLELQTHTSLYDQNTHITPERADLIFELYVKG